MSTVVKRKRLSGTELNQAEAELRRKYPHVIKGSLKNLAGRGQYAGKRTVTIKCSSPRCTATRRVATSDLSQVRFCEDCTQERRAERRKAKPR